jgi:hypothetical protein
MNIINHQSDFWGSHTLKFGGLGKHYCESHLKKKLYPGENRSGIPWNSTSTGKHFMGKIRQMFMWDSMEFHGKLHEIHWNSMEFHEIHGI